MAPVLFSAVVAIWILATVLCQWPWTLSRVLRTYDPLQLIPSYIFFAPCPGRCDYALAYRDINDEGTPTAWRQVLLQEDHKWHHSLWFPQKRHTKALIDLSNSLVRLAATRAPSDLQLSLPYLMLLNVAAAQPKQSLSRLREFIIIEFDGSERTQPPRVVFRSQVHSV